MKQQSTQISSSLGTLHLRRGECDEHDCDTDSDVYQLFTMNVCVQICQNCIVVRVCSSVYYYLLSPLILLMSLCLHVRAAPMSIKAPGPQCTSDLVFNLNYKILDKEYPSAMAT